MNTKNTTYWTELHTAAKNCDQEAVARLIRNGADLDAVTKLDWTPLHFAAKYGYLNCCRLLIEAGASMVIPTKLRFFTPIHIAALEGHTDVVRLFLDSGVDINIRTAEGWTPLHAAVEHAQWDTVQFLLERGADPNLAKRATMATFPLHSAARNGRRDIVRLLLDFGADPDVRNEHGKYPHELAEEVGFSGLAELLKIPTISTEPAKEPDSTWIMNLIRSGDLQRLKNWLNEGSSLSYVPKNGQSLLSYAVFFGQPSTVRYLLEQGARPRGKFGWYPGSALNGLLASGMASGRKEYIDVADILLDYGAKPISDKEDVPNPFEPPAMCCVSIQVFPLSLLDRLETAGLAIEPALKKSMALRWAVKFGDHTEAEQLLKDGADPNVAGKYGDVDAPLHAAIQKNDLEMVRLLVKHGANVNKKSGYDNSFLYDAVDKGNFEIVKILVEAGANVNRKMGFALPIQAALSKGNAKIVDYLVKHGAEIGSRTNWGNGVSTPIFSALKSGDGDLIRKMIDQGADIHAVGNYGNTLLHAAVDAGLVEWVRYFIEKGLSLEAKNRWNQTPLQLAVNSHQDEIVKLLLEHGASTAPPPMVSSFFYAITLRQNDVLERMLQEDRAAANRFSQDHDGNLYDKMPLVVALEHGNIEAVELLIKYGASITGAKTSSCSEAAWGDSALSYVSRTGMKEMLLRFLREKINIDSKSSPRPALHCAASIEIAQILLDHGANPYLRSNEHRTALECQLHNEDVAALLRDVMSREPSSST